MRRPTYHVFLGTQLPGRIWDGNVGALIISHPYEHLRNKILRLQEQQACLRQFLKTIANAVGRYCSDVARIVFLSSFQTPIIDIQSQSLRSERFRQSEQYFLIFSIFGFFDRPCFSPYHGITRACRRPKPQSAIRSPILAIVGFREQFWNPSNPGNIFGKRGNPSNDSRKRDHVCGRLTKIPPPPPKPQIRSTATFS